MDELDANIPFRGASLPVLPPADGAGSGLINQNRRNDR